MFDVRLANRRMLVEHKLIGILVEGSLIEMTVDILVDILTRLIARALWLLILDGVVNLNNLVMNSVCLAITFCWPFKYSCSI